MRKMSVEKPLGNAKKKTFKLGNSNLSGDIQDWQEERQLLLNLIEKNQRLFQQSQLTWQKEKEDINEHYSQMEGSMENKLA